MEIVKWLWSILMVISVGTRVQGSNLSILIVDKVMGNMCEVSKLLGGDCVNFTE